MTVVVTQLPRPLPLADTVPGWLGPAVLLVGVASLTLWASQTVFDRVFPVQTNALGVLILLLTVIGVVFTTIGALSQTGYVGQFNLLLIAAGRFVEGGAVIRGIRKLRYMIAEHPFMDETRSSSSRTDRPDSGQWLPLPSMLERFPGRAKIRYMLIQASIGFTAVGVYLLALWVNGLTENTLYVITLTWTLSVFILAVLGLSWTLEYAEERLAPSLIIGLISMSAGAHIHDYVNLVWDLTAVFVGLCGFLLGIVVGAVAAIIS